MTSSDPAGLTLRGLATSAGASNGTIYHAFSSKEDLLAKLWLRAWSRLGALMNGALETTSGDRDGRERVVAVALTPVELVHRFPTSAQLFFTQRRDQLFSTEPPAEVAAELDSAQQRFVELLIMLAQGVWNRRDRDAVEAISVCVVDAPSGVLRRLLLEGRRPDDLTARRVEAAVRAILDVPLDPPPTQERGSR